MKLKHWVLGFGIGMAVFGAMTLVGCGDEASVTETQGAQTVSAYLLISQTTDNNALKPPGEPDWAPGWVKTECGRGSGLAVGLSYSGSQNHILDCNNAGWGVNDYAYQVLNVRSRDDNQIGIGYDWAPGYYKGACQGGYAISGIATDPNGAHGLAYIKCNNVNGLHTPNNIGFYGSNNLIPTVTPFREYNAEPVNSWDPGHSLAQCGDGRFLVGIAHGSDQHPVFILCGGDPYGLSE